MSLLIWRCSPYFLKFRYNAYGIRSLADEHNQLIAEAIDSSMENQWRLPPSQNSAFPLSSYPQLGALSDLGPNGVSSLSKMDRQPLSFLGHDFGGINSGKQENQTLRPFFDEWPKARDSWPGLSDDNTNLASFPATQLSISIPMASSDFSVASSQSPNGKLSSVAPEKLTAVLMSSPCHSSSARSLTDSSNAMLDLCR